MTEWLFEEGIGENRAILVEEGISAEALIEWPGELCVGTVVEARISKILVPSKRAILNLTHGGDALLEPIPPGLAEGARVNAEIIREALPEAGRAKLSKARITDAAERKGPTLRERMEASGHKVRPLSATGPDLFEQAGWSELLEEAASGEIPFDGGSLRMSLTPAMTLFDVDGALPPAALAIAGAQAAARAIRRFGIGGSIGIDLPTLPSREDRQKAAQALDSVLPQPYERTAVNGFGFLQVVRRRERLSIAERAQYDPAGMAARALLRLAGRTPGSGPRTIHTAPSVAAKIEENPEWMERLGRLIGAPAVLRADPGLAISAGYVHSNFIR